MRNERITKKEMVNIHNEVVEIIRLKLIGYGYNVTPSQNPSYDFNVDDKRCKVSAHKNINNSVVIEYATSKHHILNAGYDTIIYMDTTNSKRNKFYMAPTKSVADAINNRLGKSKYYFQVSRKDVLINDGICIGIAENVFERIDGVELFEY
jgi:hypothetical protein